MVPIILYTLCVRLFGLQRCLKVYSPQSLAVSHFPEPQVLWSARKTLYLGSTIV
jgi:hypothetical protein